ncbi:MAG: glycosyltransferase family 9 protein [Firmicutes bacterium]|nr:glycosyltransferase family 9 protein [Bacillota bacterium]
MNIGITRKSVIKNILVIHTHGGLGDLLLSIPVFRSLRAEYPQARIDAMVRESFVDVISGDPAINSIIPIPSRMDKGFAHFTEQLSLITKGRYDLAIVLWSQAREAWLLTLAGVPIRVGQDGRLLYSFLFTHRLVRKSDQGDESTHWVENQLDFLRILGIEPIDKSVSIYIPEEARQYADNLLKSEGIKDGEFLIGYHTSKGLPVDSTRWPVEKFAAFGDSLAEKFNAKLVFTGSPSEKKLVDEIRSYTKAPSISVAGKTNIKQMAAIAKRCNLFVCPDSGPMHIAAAVGTPVVGIYGLKEDFPKRWAPYNCRHKIVRLENIPCDLKCVKADCPRFKCYEAIPEEMVVKAAEEVLRQG